MSSVTPNPNALPEMIAIAERDLQSFVENATALTKQHAPVDSGNLRSSIAWRKLRKLRWRVFTSTKGKRGRDVRGKFTAASGGYGRWVEEGTSRMAAQPYFAPAFAQAVREFRGTKFGAG